MNAELTQPVTLNGFRKNTEPTSQYEYISPEIAAEMLKKNIKNNRPFASGTTWKKYAEYMKAGLWDDYNGETIKVTSDGHIIDGQNRLMAIIKSGVTRRFLVVRGVKEESMVNIDMGKPRTAGNQLHFAGIPNSTTAAAAVQTYFNLKNGIYYALACVATKGSGRGGGGIAYNAGSPQRRLHPEEIIEIYNSNPTKWAFFISHFRVKCVAIETTSNIAALWAFLSDINEGDAFNFFSGLVSGSDLAEGSPILALRNRLILAKNSRAYYLTPGERYFAYVTAWNAYRKGKEIKYISIKAEKNIKPI